MGEKFNTKGVGGGGYHNYNIYPYTDMTLPDNYGDDLTAVLSVVDCVKSHSISRYCSIHILYGQEVLTIFA